MRKRVIMIVLAFVMLLCPAVVFADNGDQAAKAPGWNAKRTIYYDKNGQPTTGLFKAPMPDGVGALFYADKKGIVRKKSGVITVDASKLRFTRSKDSEGHWGFRPVSSYDDNTYKYLISTKGTGAIVEDAGIYKIKDGRKYYVGKNGTVKTESGLVKVKGKTYFVNRYGRVRTNKGWLYHNGKKYFVLEGGAVRTREGVLIYNGKRYIVKSGGSIQRGKGAIKANNKVYYVKNSKGHLGTKKAYTNNGKTYHVNKYGVVYVGRHKWGKELYFSVNKGYLRTASGTVTRDGKRFFVQKGGLILTNQKISFKGRQFISDNEGYFKTGLFSWKGYYWYADSRGVLQNNLGITEIGNYHYFVGSEGCVYSNKKFWANGKLYIADGSGHLLSGIFYWNGKYYYANSDYTVDTKSELLTVNHKYYCNEAGGGLARNRWVKFNGRHYYAGNEAAFLTGTLTFNGVNGTVTVTAGTDGSISEKDYNKVFKKEEESEEEPAA